MCASYNVPTDFLEQVRYACKHYGNISRMSVLSIAYDAYHVYMEGYIVELDDSDFDEYIRGDECYKRYYAYLGRLEKKIPSCYIDPEFPDYGSHFYRYSIYGNQSLTKGVALMEVIDFCVEVFSSDRSDPYSTLIYDCLYSYIHQGNSAIESPYQKGIISQSTYYNRVRDGLSILAHHLGLLFSRHIQYFEYTPLNVTKIRSFISCREREILILASDKNLTSTKELACFLGISEHTVETYWRRIRAKLGVCTRTGAVVIANQLGII